MKKKILIASLLKPVDDVRSYWKLSKSLAKTNKYEVNIIGNASKKVSGDQLIHFLPSPLRRKQYIKRWLRARLLLFTFIKMKPDVLVISTHELLFSAVIFKWFSKGKVIYDIQENYAANLRYIRGGIVGNLASKHLTFWEKMLSRKVDHFWLAEQCYAKELQFTKGRSSFIENKAISHQIIRSEKSELHLLFSGTVSYYSGIEQAVSWYQQIKSSNTSVKLLIIGQVHDLKIENWLTDLAFTDPHLQLKISRQPIPYEEILKAIKESNLGLVSYNTNQVNNHKVPTKIYEYSRYRLPYLVIDHTHWANVGKLLGGAMPVEKELKKPTQVLRQMHNNDQLFPKKYPEQATWEFESQTVIDSIKSLLNLK